MCWPLTGSTRPAWPREEALLTSSSSPVLRCSPASYLPLLPTFLCCPPSSLTAHVMGSRRGAKALEDVSFGHNTAQIKRKGEREERMIILSNKSDLHVTGNTSVRGQLSLGSLDQNTLQVLSHRLTRNK